MIMVLAPHKNASDLKKASKSTTSEETPSEAAPE
jgi:hypothetical protein